MAAQSGKHVVAVLPDRLHHNQRGIYGQRLENLDPCALAVDEAVPLRLVNLMTTLHLPAE
jgi:hypothetical protein